MIKVVNKRFHKQTYNGSDYYIGRGSVFGNPYSHLNNSKFKVIKVATRDQAVERYVEEFPKLLTNPTVKKEFDKLVERHKSGLDINLVCYCEPANCHGRVIKKAIEKVNAE